MPRIERSARVVWEGNVARGAGTIRADTGAFSELGFSLPTRVGQSEGKTSPEELLAAAHGGCITMSLAGELTKAGTPPGHLQTTVTIHMDEVEGQGHQIVGSIVEFVVSAAAERGVRLDCLVRHYVGAAAGAGIVLGYAGPARDDLERALAVVAEVLAAP